jgi:hypothetical protein
MTMTESAAPTERAEQWWRQLDERVRSIVREEWESYHSAVVAEALGETIDQIDRAHDELRRSIGVLEREVVQVRDQLALRTAVDDIAASVNAAAAKMPDLEAGLARDLRRIRHDVEVARALVEPNETKWRAEVGELSRRLARLRTKLSTLDYRLDAHLGEEEAVRAYQRREAEAQARREEREQREREQAAERDRSPLLMIADSAVLQALAPPAEESQVVP